MVEVEDDLVTGLLRLDVRVDGVRDPGWRLGVEVLDDAGVALLDGPLAAEVGVFDRSDPVAESIMDAARRRWIVGTGADVRAEIAAFAARHGVAEVMVSPVAGSFEGEPMDAAPGRLQTLELLAA